MTDDLGTYIHINNGYLLPIESEFFVGTHLNWKVWNKKFNECAKAVENKMFELYAKCCMTSALLAYDGLCLGEPAQPPEPSQDPILWATWSLEKSSFPEVSGHVLDQIQKRMKSLIVAPNSICARDPEVDFECRLFMNFHSQGLLVRIVTERQEARDVIKKILPIQGYSHTDDDLEDIPEDEYAKRGAVWSDVVNQRALCFDLCNHADFYSLIIRQRYDEDIQFRSCVPAIARHMDSILDKRRRVRRLAESYVIKQYFDNEKGLSQVFYLLRTHAEEVEEKIDQYIELIEDNPFDTSPIDFLRSYKK